MEVHSKFKLIVTVALKQEIDIPWLSSLNYPIVTLKSLLAGDDSKLKISQKSILFVITGVGPDCAKKAAEWISSYVAPEYVINYGSCGYTGDDLSMGEVCSQTCFIPDSMGISLKHSHMVDMEAEAQYEIFKGAQSSFHVIKVLTDYNNVDRDTDFYKNLPQVRVKFKELFSYIDPQNYTVSVIIPTYNRASLLKRSIDSVLDQCFKPLEIIIVDDGSSDQTPSILSEYTDKIKVITLTENRGVSYARNQGIKCAQGNWISFLDSDDEWKKDKLQNQVDYLKKHPYFKLIQSDEIWIRNGDHFNKKKYHQKKEGWIFDISLERCLISPSSVMIKSEVFDEFGLFDEALPVCEDYDLWLRLTRHLPVAFEPSRTLIKYGGHSDQLSNAYEVMDRYRVKSLKASYLNEKDMVIKALILSVLDKKQSIIDNGAKKRQAKLLL